MKTKPWNVGFPDRVRAVVRSIPKGKTMTYKEVSRKAGHPGASRAVGGIMRNNYDPTVPCHRVIRSDGGLGGYNRGGIEKKRSILKKEGVKFDKKGKPINHTVA